MKCPLNCYLCVESFLQLHLVWAQLHKSKWCKSWKRLIWRKKSELLLHSFSPLVSSEGRVGALSQRGKTKKGCPAHCPHTRGQCRSLVSHWLSVWGDYGWNPLGLEKFSLFSFWVVMSWLQLTIYYICNYALTFCIVLISK